jgi:hypothetical protein
MENAPEQIIIVVNAVVTAAYSVYKLIKKMRGK